MGNWPLRGVIYVEVFREWCIDAFRKIGSSSGTVSNPLYSNGTRGRNSKLPLELSP